MRTYYEVTSTNTLANVISFTTPDAALIETISRMRRIVIKSAVIFKVSLLPILPITARTHCFIIVHHDNVVNYEIPAHTCANKISYQFLYLITTPVRFTV